MYPLQHLIFGTFFSAVLLLLFSNIGAIGFLLILTSSVLIDIDHCIYYVYKKKDWNLRNAYKYFVENERRMLSLPRKRRSDYYSGFILLHGFEVILILVFLGLVISNLFLFISVGFSFHLFLDFVYDRKYHDRIDRLSIIYDYFKFKKLRHYEKE